MLTPCISHWRSPGREDRLHRHTLFEEALIGYLLKNFSPLGLPCPLDVGFQVPVCDEFTLFEPARQAHLYSGTVLVRVLLLVEVKALVKLVPQLRVADPLRGLGRLRLLTVGARSRSVRLWWAENQARRMTTLLFTACDC